MDVCELAALLGSGKWRLKRVTDGEIMFTSLRPCSAMRIWENGISFSHGGSYVFYPTESEIVGTAAGAEVHIQYGAGGARTDTWTH